MWLWSWISIHIQEYSHCEAGMSNHSFLNQWYHWFQVVLFVQLHISVYSTSCRNDYWSDMDWLPSPHTIRQSYFAPFLRRNVQKYDISYINWRVFDSKLSSLKMYLCDFPFLQFKPTLTDGKIIHLSNDVSNSVCYILYNSPEFSQTFFLFHGKVTPPGSKSYDTCWCCGCFHIENCCLVAMSYVMVHEILKFSDESKKCFCDIVHRLTRLVWISNKHADVCLP